MKQATVGKHDIISLQELTSQEIELVGGAGTASGGAALGLAGAIGMATWGGAWGAVGVGAAFAFAPVAVLAMGGLVAYGGYSLWKEF
jgi:hypothetical protein